MSSKPEKPLHVIALEVSNVKRLRAVRVTPGAGPVVVIGGKNAQGKSSTLDAIEMALGGGKAIPTEPIRHGARKGGIVVNLGELVIERTFTAAGSQLVVRGADGTPQKSPQAILDALCSKIAFDPVAFLRHEPKKQDEILKQVIGLDFAQLDSERETLFRARADVKRASREREALLATLPQPVPGLPAQEVSSAELAVELERRREVEASNARKNREHVAHVQERLANDDELARLRGELAMAERREATLAEEAARLDAEVLALVDPNVAEIRDQLAGVDELNAKIRANGARSSCETLIAAIGAKADELTDAIASIDEKKQEALAAAKFPVEGLGFDETGPTLNGVPLEQASQAEKLRLSVAIGAALNPRLRVILVRDGSVLDDEAMRLLAELAQANDLQVWLERVGDKDPGAVVIEDGMVRASTEAAE